MCYLNEMRNIILLLVLLYSNLSNAQSNNLNLSNEYVYTEVLKHYIERIEYADVKEIYLVDNSTILPLIPSEIMGFSIKNFTKSEVSLLVLKQKGDYIAALHLSDLRIENGQFYIKISDVFIRRKGKQIHFEYSDLSTIKVHFKLKCDPIALEFECITFE